MASQDQVSADEFYQTIDTYLRILGGEKVGRTDVFFRLSRVAIGANIDFSEMQRAVARISSLSAWYDAWRVSAEHFWHLAEQAETNGNDVTAGEHFLRAALLFHFAQLFTRPEDPRRSEGQQYRVELYRKACPLLSPPIEPIVIPHGQIEIPAYLRLPPIGQPVGVVIMLPGANSVKEELHNWGWDFNKRGLATIALDGPGQGELSVRNGGVPLRFESYHESVVAVLDYVEGLQGVPADRVAVWGQSTGGHLAIRGAAHDERIAAAVSLGGGYDFRLETAATTPVDVREEARDLHGFDSFREAEEYVRAEGSLKLIIGRVSAPLLLIHGGQDNIVALEEMEQIKEEASGPTELWVYPDGNHSVCNLNLEMSPRMADWVLAVLAGQDRPRR